MKCPQCGNEVPDNSNFCPACGFKFVNEQLQISDDPAHEVMNTATSMSGGVTADSSYRNEPGFRGKIIRLNILGAIGFVGSGLACFGSAMLKFGEKLTDTDYLVYLLMLIIGLLVGVIIVFGFIIPSGKKLFPDGKAKGFLENLPGVWLGFSISFIVVALVFQGFILIVS